MLCCLPQLHTSAHVRLLGIPCRGQFPWVLCQGCGYWLEALEIFRQCREMGWVGDPRGTSKEARACANLPAQPVALATELAFPRTTPPHGGGSALDPDPPTPSCVGSSAEFVFFFKKKPAHAPSPALCCEPVMAVGTCRNTPGWSVATKALATAPG